jgi:hypothetical protein
LEILARIEALTREVRRVTIHQNKHHDAAERESGPFSRAGQADER